MQLQKEKEEEVIYRRLITTGGTDSRIYCRIRRLSLGHPVICIIPSWSVEANKLYPRRIFSRINKYKTEGKFGQVRVYVQ